MVFILGAMPVPITIFENEREKMKKNKNIKLSRIIYDRVRNRNNKLQILTDYLTFE